MSSNDVQLQEVQCRASASETDGLNTCECVENSTADCLHNAVEAKNLQKVKQIIQQNASALLQRNKDHEIPLHLACKYEVNIEIVKALLGVTESASSDGIDYHRQSQLEAKNGIFANTPLHVAACIGNTQIASTILEYGDSGFLLGKKNKLRDTPVHNAASRGHDSVLELMYEKSKRCISSEGRFKGLPLHSACGYGRITAAKKLLEWDKTALEKPSVSVTLPAFTVTTERAKIDENKKNYIKETIERLSDEENREVHEHYTPLTRACQFGHESIVELLLQEGAMAHPIALIKAIEGLYKECVKLLIFKDKKNFRKELLHFPYITDGSVVLTTPFRELIKHMPDVAERVLQQCVDFERFLVNSKSFKIKLNYEFVDDDGKNWKRRLTDNGIEAQHQRRLAYRYATHHSTSTEETDFEIPTRNIGFNKETHPLSLMVKFQRESLLTHPVVAALIHDKWKSIYGVLSFVQWFFYFFFLGCTTALLFVLPNPSSSYCVNDINISEESEQNRSTCIISSNASDLECEGMPSKINDEAKIWFLLVSTVLYSVYRLMFELYQLVSSLYLAYFSLCCNKKRCVDLLGAITEVNYIWSLINWIEVPLFVLSLILSITVAVSSNFEKPFCPLAWQWQMGIIVLWLSWIELIFLSTQFKIIGVYALMFFRVLKTIIKFIPLAFLLIVAFGLTFHFLLHSPELKASPYFTPGFSFLKTLSMTTGDVGADDFFALDIDGRTRNTSHLQYVQLSTFTWLLSLILMTILLSNLLIGLAVGDITTILEKAKIEKLALQVDYVLTAESQSPKCLRKLGNRNQKEFEPNNTSTLEKMGNEIVYLLWGGVRYDSQESIKRLIKDSETLNQ